MRGFAVRILGVKPMGKSEEALEICELALVLNEERGGGQNIVQCLKEALRIREWYSSLPMAKRKESLS